MKINKQAIANEMINGLSPSGELFANSPLRTIFPELTKIKVKFDHNEDMWKLSWEGSKYSESYYQLKSEAYEALAMWVNEWAQ